MPVDMNLAYFSDLSYRSALVIYVFALVLSAVYYVRVSAARTTADQRAKQPALVGATGSDATTSHSSAGSAAAGTAKARTTEKLGNMAQTLVWLAVLIQGASVVLRGLATSRFPWGNLYEYISLTTFLAMVIASVILARKNLTIMWPWVLVPVVALVFYGGVKLSVAAGPLNPALKSYWIIVHVSIVSAGAGVGLISGVASLMYVLRMRQTPGKETGFFGTIARPLPSAKTLDAIAYKCAIWALPIFGLGIVLGALWAESAWGRFWNWDPKETVSLITWVLYAAYLHARATSGWRDQKAAWINILAFATMVFNLFFINLVVQGLHSYAGLN
ncbi:c-type cytochrome biogenesis protein CcsB [Corynebacterium mendelii]|uniref:C-type cytochrome biogenesis protein CcsB n=1 Tax=Corynebacterium mendelii TaxID=2765362 RepID=A0A939E1S7_9CORY|nr:c-type cytochrome biogenesis protein CcsB [Corynebacterium mendelii]MBN9643892.1 c-type cytochrome biogenesis protein CcsB [Corynebacterium mendelii]